MPKKKPEPPGSEPQSDRFRRAIRELEDAGELSPTEADEKFERMFRKIVPSKGSHGGT